MAESLEVRVARNEEQIVALTNAFSTGIETMKDGFDRLEQAFVKHAADDAEIAKKVVEASAARDAETGLKAKNLTLIVVITTVVGLVGQMLYHAFLIAPALAEVAKHVPK